MHAKGKCQGWMQGPYDLSQCRRCWRLAERGIPNLATERSTPLLTMPPTVVRSSTIALPVLSPCVELGDVFFGQTCGCQEKLRRCGVYGQCTTGVYREGVACCANWNGTGTRCPDYLPAGTPERQTNSDLTLAITQWQRPTALRRLLDSVYSYLPNYAVEVEDTNGNLSAGRNRLYSRVTTPFLLMLEEDFVVLPTTAAGVASAVEILNADPTIAGVGGIAHEPKPGEPPPGQESVRSMGAVRWGHNFKPDGGRMGIVASRRPLRTTPSGIKYRPCDLILNFGVFRTSLFTDVPYDEGFPIHEHKEYFWRASQAGKEFAFLSSLVVHHLRDHPSAEWINARRRSFSHRTRKKHGFTFEREV